MDSPEMPPPLELDAALSAASAVALNLGRGCASARDDAEEEDEDARSSSKICRCVKAAFDALRCSEFDLPFSLLRLAEVCKRR